MSDALTDEEEPDPVWDGVALTDSIFIGGECCAFDSAERSRLAITHVVSCLTLYEESFPPNEAERTAGRWLVVRLADAATSDIMDEFDKVCKFVHVCLEAGGKILVHSLEGASRAAALVIAYLMKHGDLTLREAFRKVATKRSQVRVNRGFWRQLHAYELYLKGKNSIKDADLPGAIIFEKEEMAAIIARFRKTHPASAKALHIAGGDATASPADTDSDALRLTGGGYCGSPRKSKQPHTPKSSSAGAKRSATGNTTRPMKLLKL